MDSILMEIPQLGTVLGQPSAAVTLEYFGDLECPYTASFHLGKGFTELVRNEVKAGSVKVSFQSLCTATCRFASPEVFRQQQVAAYAAGLQQKFWDYVQRFFSEQGTEGSGYVTEEYLTELADATVGLELSAWQAARREQADELFEEVLRGESVAATFGVRGTPGLVIAGPGGNVAVGSSEASADTYRDLRTVISEVA